MRVSALSVVALVPSFVAAQSPPKRTYIEARAYANAPARMAYSPSFVNRLRAPQGFRVNLFADKLGGPRMLAVGENGTVYVTRRDSGDVLALRDNGRGMAGAPRKVVTALPGVHGIAIASGRMYLATVHDIYVADLRADGSVGEPRAIVTDLPDGGQHGNRTIGIGPDGMLYVSVGSTCNQCAETNPENATLLRMQPDGSMRGIYARGLRNTVGWGWHPGTGDLWGMDHGSDWQGNDIPPEELNRIGRGNHFGWPYCRADRRVDNHISLEPKGSSKEELCPGTVAPALTYQAHSAPIQLAFYTGSQFPGAYRNDAFVAMRGSWNRLPATGYKVVRIRFGPDGQPRQFEDFLTGFLNEDGASFIGRVAGIAVTADGSLLVTDDANGAIYRVSYGGGGLPARTAGAAGAINYSGGEVGEVSSQTPAKRAPASPVATVRLVNERVAWRDSLSHPESVRLDADQNVLFVSNINGKSLDADGNGFISRLDADGVRGNLRWIESGRNGVVLNAPKGMAIVGDTLWVSDITVMRAFNRRTGAPITSVDLGPQGAAFLNDVAADPDGAVYVTDTELEPQPTGNLRHVKTDRIFRVNGRAGSVALESDRLQRPNGIAWDASGSRFIVVPFGGDTVMAWRPGGEEGGTAALQPLAVGPGLFDGVAIAPTGDIYVSSKATGSVYQLRGDKLEKVLDHLDDPADIEFDAPRDRIAIPMTATNRVEYYKVRRP